MSVIPEMVKLVDQDEKLSQGICSSAAESLLVAFVQEIKDGTLYIMEQAPFDPDSWG